MRIAPPNDPARISVLLFFATTAFVAAADGDVVSGPGIAAARVAQSQWNTPALRRLMHEWEVKLEKMELHLQPAMQHAGVDMWIILSREFNVDPMLQMFGDYGISGWYGHRNAYIFYAPGNGAPLERTLIGTHQSGRMREFFPTIIGYGEEGLKPHLAEFIAERDPQRIAINRSRTVAMADGITAELLEYLQDSIGPEYSSRLVSALSQETFTPRS